MPYENLYPDPFNRELLTLADGATIALDWDGDIPKAGQILQQPLVVIAPGLNGGTHNIYTIELLKEARRQGYKVVTIVFRGAEGLPVTTPKLSCSSCWKDV